MPGTTPIKPDFDIEITTRKDANGNPTAEPPKPLPTMRVGQTVRYFSKDGEVRIVFPERSPFREDSLPMTQVPGSMILTLVSDTGPTPNDVLRCRCFITPPNGPEFGWAGDPSPSGGDHHVGH